MLSEKMCSLVVDGNVILYNAFGNENELLLGQYSEDDQFPTLLKGSLLLLQQRLS